MGRLMFLAGAGPPISSLVGRNTIAPYHRYTTYPMHLNVRHAG